MMEIHIKLTAFLLVIAISAAKIHGRGSRPEFKRRPIRDVVALLGGSHNFKCKVKGYPKPLLSWYRENEIVSTKLDERIKKGRYSMLISNLKESDSGKYACRAANKYGELWGNFTLLVLQDEGPPEFKKRNHKFASLTRRTSTSVEFDCDVIANPEASITWSKDGKTVTAKPEKLILVDFKLTVESLTFEDGGEYTCIVYNEYGSVARTTKLEVMPDRIAVAPILEDMKNQTVCSGDTVNFICQIVISDSQPLVQWLLHFKKKDSYVNEKGQPHVAVLQSSDNRRTADNQDRLVLRNVTKEDQGWYTCLVANTVGMNFVSAWLQVENDCTLNNRECGDNATCDRSQEVCVCKCNAGFTGDGYNCTNIDECSEMLFPCHEDYVCEDREPGYFCAPRRAQKLRNQRRPT